MTARLRLEGVAKRFGPAVALDGVSLDVAPGEYLAVLGRSGSGKTTLLRVVAGLEAPSSGRVWIGDRDVTDLAPAERDVAMVFQTAALLPHLTVAGNIAFGLRPRRLPRAEVAERVEAAARLAGCHHLLDRRPTALSGGERQRAALARAVARRPGQVLLDEPFAGLDAPVRAAVRGELRAMLAEVAATVVHVTHDQAEALTLGDRVAVVDAGRVLQVAPPDDLVDRPASRAVAEFVGSPGMSVLPVVPGEPCRAGPFPVTVPAPLDPGALVAGVRPEAVRLAGGAEGVPASVVLVEVVGEQALVHLRAGDSRLVAAAARVGRPAAGDVVHAVVDPGRFHLFDAATGEAVWHPAPAGRP